MKYHITKIKLHNFKRYKDLTIEEVNPDINIFIGDNESGKSTILQAIDLVSRGSRRRVENIGLDKLFNIEALNEYMGTDRDLKELPEMYVELYLSNQDKEARLEGMNNSIKQVCSGIRLRCIYNDDYNEQIAALLQNPNASFPLEFYKIEFDTFAGNSYNGYTKKLKSIFIDNSNIGHPYAMREYVNDIYNSQLTPIQRIKTKHEYRNVKKLFQEKELTQFNKEIDPYNFAIKDSVDNNIETDITLHENEVPLENKGTGIQCFIKTELSMKRGVDTDLVLIEEPENHLSYMKMLELIELIRGSDNRQLFISTHCDLIATRLNLKKCLLFNSMSTNVVSLANLSDDTANFFMKAPDNNMLQFVLSPKSILVEGDAEFILMEAFYKNTTEKELSASGIGVISVDGKCFKRYLEIAKLLNKRVAVITDNDHDYTYNIVTNYSDYMQNQFDNIRIFSDNDNDRYTFEVCIYKDNMDVCDSIFQNSRRRLPTLKYMLRNKADAAYELLNDNADTLIVPQYIQDAIAWIDE